MKEFSKMNGCEVLEALENFGHVGIEDCAGRILRKYLECEEPMLEKL